MDLRDSKSRLILIVIALGAALVITVASCSGGGGDSEGGEDGDAAAPSEISDTEGTTSSTEPSESSSEEEEVEPEAEPLAMVTGEAEITLMITRAERESGGFLTVEGTLHNGSGDGWRSTAWAGQESELAENGFSMAGASLTAQEEGKRYLILRDTDGRCLCTNFELNIAAGDTVRWFAQFPEPAPSTTYVDFQIGQMPPATIEIR